MSRIVLGLAVCAAAVAGAGMARAADYGAGQAPFFKPAYPADWGMEEDDVGFEAGLRYWYAMGSQRTSINGLPGTFSTDDTSHLIEAHLRIDDYSTNTYLKGQVGYGFGISGTYNNNFAPANSPMSGGRIAYAGADLGVQSFGDRNTGVGGFLGYHYWNDSPDMGRTGFMLPNGGGSSEVNSLDIHALRLGVSGRAQLSDMVDFNVEGAFVPYAYLTGHYGGVNIADIGPMTQASPLRVNGHLYGAMAEALVGIHPTQNLTVRVGARAWYLTGQADVDFTMRNTGNPAVAQAYITNTSGLEFFRWGPMLEVTGRF